MKNVHLRLSTHSHAHTHTHSLTHSLTHAVPKLEVRKVVDRGQVIAREYTPTLLKADPDDVFFVVHILEDNEQTPIIIKAKSE